MTDLDTRLHLKNQLKRTWEAFFTRHGNFTAIQLAAMPAILAGENVVISAATASGKTEAALVPLIERYAFANQPVLTLLYITPTKALANDLLERLGLPCANLGLRLAIKTRDLKTFNPDAPSHILITTPESLDSLMTGQAKVLAQVQAVVMDELHLLDSTPRGDQLRAVLARLRQIRTYAHQQADAPHATLQMVGVSATLSQPQQVAERYMSMPTVIEVEGKRPIESELLPLHTAQDLLDCIWTFQKRGWKKALVFCNTRAEVEEYAQAVYPNSPFGNAVYVHYSNISPARRAEIEARFAEDEVALCFASTTLELGIDIGSIDAVLLIGAPGDYAAFLQRIGRGNRRKNVTTVLGFYRTPLEELLFRVLLDAPVVGKNVLPFQLSIIIQQIFSLIKQSPHGAIRLATLHHLFGEMVDYDDLQAMVGRLVELEYLQAGRPDEWKPARHLQTLYDAQAMADTTLSIYSNIKTDSLSIQVLDQTTGRLLARVNRQWATQEKVVLEGRTLDIQWQDHEAVWVKSSSEQPLPTQGAFLSRRPQLAFEVAWALPRQFNLPSGVAPLVATNEGWYLFHWLGDVYGKIVLDFLRPRLAIEESAQPGLCFVLQEPLAQFPAWSIPDFLTQITEQFHRYEKLLGLGAFHAMLPAALRSKTVLEQIDVVRLVNGLYQLRLQPMPEFPLDWLLLEG